MPLGSGGTITIINKSGVYWAVHKFTTLGAATFVAPPYNISADILVVGGGGSYNKAATNWFGAPGGAGKFDYRTGVAIPSSSSKSVYVGRTYTAPSVVGAGFTGESSVFDDITCVGGQGGGVPNACAGGNSGNGFSGGTRYLFNPSDGAAGSSANGLNSTGANDIQGKGGAGGNGTSCSIDGTATYYCGGAGGAGNKGTNGNGLGYTNPGGTARNGIVIVSYAIPPVTYQGNLALNVIPSNISSFLRFANIVGISIGLSVSSIGNSIRSHIGNIIVELFSTSTSVFVVGVPEFLRIYSTTTSENLSQSNSSTEYLPKTTTLERHLAQSNSASEYLSQMVTSRENVDIKTYTGVNNE